MDQRQGYHNSKFTTTATLRDPGMQELAPDRPSVERRVGSRRADPADGLQRLT